MSSSAADRWPRVKSITADALERAHAARGAFVAQECAGDDTLRAEVESLLGAHAGAGSFLETPGVAETGAARAVEEFMAPDPAGRPLGPYRIVRELGHGGMGVVYLAERADAAFEKQVAIKVVRGGLAGESARRFRDERRILATLDHPNIARLLDGGTTDDGLPYLVMEYVDGMPVDAYCESAALGTIDRVRLFAQVCAAVQYAHQHLVIHRDLKPRNILVTADGTPKLLDFGIAKLVEPGPGEEQTRTALRVLTLEGASPEQVRGDPLAVTSDVYSLGVLLYRLLTGRSPYGTERRTDTDLMRAICDDLPPKPSAIAPADRRSQVRGELDWITLQALRKEPERRYASAEHLADDLRRHLTGRPVSAGPDSWRYRARKLVARHRGAVAAGTLLALSLAAGVTATLWQARRAEEQRARAERRFADVRKLANSFLFEHDEAIRNLPGSTPARELLVRRALQYLDGLSAEASDDRSLRRELAQAYQKVGEVQNHPVLASLGDSTGAMASYGKALAILARLSAEDPADARVRLDLASCHAAIGTLEWTAGKGTAAAVKNYNQALALREAVVRENPADIEARLDLVRSHRSLGDVTEEANGLHYQRAAELSAALIEEQPANTIIRSLHADSLERLGYDLAARVDNAKALERFDEARQLRRALLAEQPTNVTFLRAVAASSFQIGTVLDAMGDSPGAVKNYGEMLAIFARLAAADPTDAQARGAMATAHTNIGRVLAKRADARGAIESYRAALAIGEPLLAADANNVAVRYTVAVGRKGMGEVHAMLASASVAPAAVRARNWREARAWFQQALEMLSDMDANDHLVRSGDKAMIDAARGEIRRCDRELARLEGRASGP